MLNEGSYGDGCSLRMWNVRRAMAPEEWDLREKWNVPAAWDGNSRGRRLCDGQWDGHGNCYEDQTESDIE
jgi:hypothetical protein